MRSRALLSSRLGGAHRHLEGQSAGQTASSELETGIQRHLCNPECSGDRLYHRRLNKKLAMMAHDPNFYSR